MLPKRPNRSPNRPALSPNRLVTELVSGRIDLYPRVRESDCDRFIRYNETHDDGDAVAIARRAAKRICFRFFRF